MVKKEILDFSNQHKGALIFAAGFATAIVGKKILESKVVKDTTADYVASVMAFKKDAEDRAAEIKENAESQLEEDEEDQEDEDEKKVIEIKEAKEVKPRRSSKKI